jgi:hypothetical protein
MTTVLLPAPTATPPNRQTLPCEWPGVVASTEATIFLADGRDGDR